MVSKQDMASKCCQSFILSSKAAKTSRLEASNFYTTRHLHSRWYGIGLLPNFSATRSSVVRFLFTELVMILFIFSHKSLAVITQLHINETADENCYNYSIISLQMFSLSS